MKLRFKRLSPDAEPPVRSHPDDAGYDLSAAEAATLGPGERTGVGTGIAVAIPAGYAGLVLPRSGLAARHGISLVNAPGLIDSGYSGELRVLLINTDPTESFEVSPGDRIAQLMIVAHAAPELAEVADLEASPRGAGGFGSTGH